MIGAIVNSAKLDKDALSFINTVGITSPIQIRALNHLVKSLKGKGLWSKIIAFYPFVGGTATMHQYNLKNPSQYTITWVSNPTHDANGVQFNGGNYGNTSLSLNALSVGTGDFHYLVYNRTHVNGPISYYPNEIGIIDYTSTPNNYCYMASIWNRATIASTTYVGGDGSNSADGAEYTNPTDNSGCFIVTRKSSTLNFLQDGKVIGTKSGNPTYSSFPSGNSGYIYVGWANPIGASPEKTRKQLAAASIGYGLTDTEAQSYSKIVEDFQTALGRNVHVSDTDARYFISTAGITDATQKRAINQLVIDLKAAGLWTKMTAIYPFVGGTAGTHAINLKTPGTYNLTFNGTWTHSSTGALPNGTTGYATTGLAHNVLGLYSQHLSYYTRTNGTAAAMIDIGGGDNTLGGVAMRIRNTDNNMYGYSNDVNGGTDLVNAANTTTQGLSVVSRTSSTDIRIFRNGSQIGLTTVTALASQSSVGITIGAYNSNGTISGYSNRECSFASIGAGLSVSEVNDLYNIVQVYQINLGRGVTDVDAQSFIVAAGITDSIQMNAVNQLVIDLKRYNLWSKMKAVYPFVGGTSSSHAVNLKTPGTYNITWNGTLTHSATGVKSNGTTGYGATGITPSSVLSATSTHLSIYSRSDTTVGSTANSTQDTDIGAYNSLTQGMSISAKDPYSSFQSTAQNLTGITSTNTRGDGFFVTSKTSSTDHTFYRNNTVLGTSSNTGTLPTVQIMICNIPLSSGSPYGIGYTNREYGFASIGDGLDSTDTANLYQIVNDYQDKLGRKIEDADANAFITAASITDATQKAAITKLVSKLKGFDIWKKMIGLYPMVGGNATAHAVNLKSPGTYNLTFNGGWTHSGTGALPNGTTGYADTGIVPSIALPKYSAHLSYYSRTSNTTDGVDIGCYTNTGAPVYWAGVALYCYYNYTSVNYPGAARFQCYAGSEAAPTVDWATISSANNPSSQGFYIGSRSGYSDNRIYKNGTQYDYNSRNAHTYTSDYSIYIGGRNASGTCDLFGNRECALASVGLGLTPTEAANFRTAVQEFQTSLSRNV